MFKKVVFLAGVVLIMFFFICVPVSHATTNKGIAKEFCKTHYPECKIKFFNYKNYNDKVMLHRANKGIVYVEKFVSYSDGKRKKSGHSKEGWYICYNKGVKKGKKVISYCVYNPYTNYCDDVTAVIDNHKIRY